jgi:hypothetical protein
MFQATISKTSTRIIIFVSLQGYLNMQGLDKKDVAMKLIFKTLDMLVPNNTFEEQASINKI